MSQVYTSIKNPAMIAKLIDNGKIVALLLIEWIWEYVLFLNRFLLANSRYTQIIKSNNRV